MEINLIADSSVGSAPAGFTAAIQAAAEVFDRDFAGDYTVNITYGWGTYDNAPDSSLTDPNSGAFSIGGFDSDAGESYATIKGWLTAGATLPDQLAAIASLPASYTSLPGDANTFFVSSAEQKALGVYAGDADAIDGSIGFNIGDGTSSSADWEEAALCEITHALGWIPEADPQGAYLAALFRYSAPGAYQWTSGQNAYFSIDGGATNLANFATSFDPTLFTNLGDNDPLNIPFTVTNGVVPTLTPFDIEVLNVIGFGSRLAPTVAAVSSVSVVEGQSVAASSLIASISNPSGDSITQYIYIDKGGGTGYFTVNGVKQADNDWIYPDGSDIVQYVGGNSLGDDTLEVGIYDFTTNSYSYSSTFTAATTIDEIVGGGHSFVFSSASGYAVGLSGTYGDWDAVSGSDGTVYLTNAQASVSGDGDQIVFSAGSGNAASLYSTNGVWDAVSGSNSTVYLDNADATVTGGGNSVGVLGGTNIVSLYGTGNAWDSFWGSNSTVYLDNADATVTGGGNTVSVLGGTNIVSLYGTGNAWDAFWGSNSTVYLDGADATVTGGGNTVSVLGGANIVSLYGTGNAWDSFWGSNSTVYLDNVDATVTGGGNSVSLLGGTNIVSLYGTGNVWDSFWGSNSTVYLNGAQAVVEGSGDTINFTSGSWNQVSLIGAAGPWNWVNGSYGTIDLNSAQTVVEGSGDSINFTSGSGNQVSLIGAAGPWNWVTGSNGVIDLNSAQTVVDGFGNTINFTSGSGNQVSLIGAAGPWNWVTGSNGVIDLNSAQTVVGGSGDTINYSSGSGNVAAFLHGIGGNDIVNGFVAGAGSTDSIQFSAQDFSVWSVLQAHMSQSGANTLIALDANDSVTLVGVTMSNLSSTQFHLV